MALALSGRTWPAPKRRWNMWMTWHDLLFAHWPVPVNQLRALIPPILEVDTFQGQAWVGVVPFGMSNVRPRLLPAVRGLSRFPELNVRSDVTVQGKPGVWFFSLDAANLLAVHLARRFFYLPYLHAKMSLQCHGEVVQYSSLRTHRGAAPAQFRGSYKAVGPAYRTTDGSLDHWLTSRYCLYAADRRGDVWRGEIDHEPWSLQPATAEIEQNSMVEPLGMTMLESDPILHYVKRLDVVAWTLERARQ